MQPRVVFVYKRTYIYVYKNIIDKMIIRQIEFVYTYTLFTLDTYVLWYIDKGIIRYYLKNNSLVGKAKIIR